MYELSLADRQGLLFYAEDIFNPLKSLHDVHLSAPNEHLSVAKLLDVVHVFSEHIKESHGLDDSCGCKKDDGGLPEEGPGTPPSKGVDVGMRQQFEQRDGTLGSDPSLETVKNDAADGQPAARKSKPKPHVTDTPAKSSEKLEAQAKKEMKTSTSIQPPKLPEKRDSLESSMASIAAVDNW